MKFHQLSITAFGPFANSVTIDFAPLDEAGLFAITGETGAGKSSILDALCFALYADVPGNRSEAKNFHSHHAPADRPPLVKLEFSTESGRWLIERSPAWQRPKKRGEGTTTENARVHVYQFDDEIPVFITRDNAEAGEWVRRVVGLTREQFCQVVMLPQGQFAEFLTCTSQQREKLLQQVFGTEIFARLTRWLADYRTQAGRLERESVAAITSTATAIAEIASTDIPDHDRYEEWIEWAHSLRDRADERKHAADKAMAEAAVGDELLAQQLRQAQQANDSVAAAGKARATLEAHIRTLPSIVVSMIGEYSSPLTASDCDRFQAIQDNLHAERNTADEAVKQHKHYHAVTDRYLQLQKQLDMSTVEYEDSKRQRAALPEQIAELRVQREKYTLIAHTAAELHKQQEALHLSRKQIVERDALQQSLIQVEKTAEIAREQRLDAREQLVLVRQERLAAIAGELAEKLVSGQPCCVCGSPVHPRPAAVTGPVKDREDELSHICDQAELTKNEADQQVSALGARIGTLTKIIATQTLDSIDNQLHLVDQKLTESTDARVRVDALDRQLQAAQTTIDNLDNQMRTVLEKQSAYIGQCDTLKAQLAELEKIGHYEQSDLAQLQREHADLKAAVGAAAGLVKTAAVCFSAENSINPEVIGQAEQLSYYRDQAKASAVERQNAANEAHMAAQQCERLTRLSGKLADGYSQWQPHHEEYARAHYLAQLAEGKSADVTIRMSLASYVLAMRFRQVVAAANQRLHKMTYGRYVLEHTFGAEKSHHSGGLELAVADAWTGRSRRPHTLSGGETFLVALALALGLSDVVSCETGALTYSTVFIDEGFGSLDDNSLDEVVEVLDALRAGGRTVGIISHVAQLRSRIATQLQVRKAPTGSLLHMQLGENLAE